MRKADGEFQYAGLSHRQVGRRYQAAPRVTRCGYSIRLLMPREIADFQKHVQDVIDSRSAPREPARCPLTEP